MAQGNAGQSRMDQARRRAPGMGVPVPAQRGSPKGGYGPLYGIGGGEAINISPPVTCFTLACG
jgi:hypothetical protein